jgi:hypothetical protein
MLRSWFQRSAVLVLDDVALVHVVFGGVADQAVDALLGLSGTSPTGIIFSVAGW